MTDASDKDLRKEQLLLLRFEKQIAGLAATLVLLGPAAKAADGTLKGADSMRAYGEVEAALMRLAEITGGAHEALNARAIEIGAKMLQATGGGLPKKDPPSVVASILGIG